MPQTVGHVAVPTITRATYVDDTHVFGASLGTTLVPNAGDPSGASWEKSLGLNVARPSWDGAVHVVGPSATPGTDWAARFTNIGNTALFTHSNTAYRSSIGFLSGGGQPFFAWHAEHAATANTWRNDGSGVKGLVVFHDRNTPSSLVFRWNGVATPNADFSSVVDALSIREDGVISGNFVTSGGGLVYNVTDSDYGLATTNTGAQNVAAWAVLLAALPAAGATIAFPAGTFVFNAAITWPAQTDIIGAGKWATTLAFTGAIEGIRGVSPGPSYPFSGRLAHLSVVGSGGATVGVHAEFRQDVVIEQVRIDGFVNQGLYLNTIIVSTIRNSFLANNGDATHAQVEVDAPVGTVSTVFTWDTNYISDSPATTVAGLSIDRTVGVVVRGGAIETTGIPVRIAGKAEATQGSGSIVIDSIDLENPNHGAITAIEMGAGWSGAAGAAVTGVTLRNIRATPSGSTTMAHAIRASNTSNVHLDNLGMAVPAAAQGVSAIELVGTGNATWTSGPNWYSSAPAYVRVNGVTRADAVIGLPWQLTQPVLSLGLLGSITAASDGDAAFKSLTSSGAVFRVGGSTGTAAPSAIVINRVGAGGFPSELYFQNAGATKAIIYNANDDNLRINVGGNDVATFRPTNSTLVNPSMGTGYLSTQKTAGSTGTTANLLAKIDATGNVVTAVAGDVGVLGIPITTQTSGQAVEVATRGIVNGVADNTTVIGNLLGVGTSTAGRVVDLGVADSTQVRVGLQIIGKALTVATVGNPVSIQLYGPGHYGASISVETVNTTPARPSRVVLDYNAAARLIGWGPNASTNGTLQFGTIRSDASNFVVEMSINGGVIVGAPTGSFKGIGAANFAADIYKNNVAFANPDYVLERWATGRIVRFADREGADRYDGLRSLVDVERFARESFALPRIAEAREAAEGGLGLFGGGDALLATVEESYLYMFQMSHEIDALRERVAAITARLDELTGSPN